MSTTRFSEDQIRVEKKLIENKDILSYHLNVPGNGLQNPYITNPEIRLQKWGANLHTNNFDINDQLRGNKKITRNIVSNLSSIKNQPIYYPHKNIDVENTRQSLPAWTFIDYELKIDNIYNYDPKLNPYSYKSSRLIHKDKFL